MTFVSRTARRTLLVTPVSPWGRSSGTQQRTALLYEALAALAPVDVLVLEETSSNSVRPGDHPAILAQLSWKQASLTVYKYGVHQWVDRWCHANLDWSRYDLVVGRYLTPMTKVRWPSWLRTIVDCDDAFYWYPPQRGNPAARAAALGRTWARYLQTRMALTRYDHVFFCSRRDRRLFRVASGSVLPNVVRASAQPLPPPAAQGTLLIVGTMSYLPNRQGVEWFLGHCWPALAQRFPDLALRIVGATGAQERARWSHAPRTTIAGYVEDLAAEYANALLAIAPINHGGGSCIKFIEAAGFGRPCVVTRHVFSAFDEDFRDEESVAVALDARQMTGKCVALLESAERRHAMARRAYETVVKRYDVARFKSTVSEGVRRTAECGRIEAYHA